MGDKVCSFLLGLVWELEGDKVCSFLLGLVWELIEIRI